MTWVNDGKNSETATAHLNLVQNNNLMKLIYVMLEKS